jgi:hypothetical protein
MKFRNNLRSLLKRAICKVLRVKAYGGVEVSFFLNEEYPVTGPD